MLVRQLIEHIENAYTIEDVLYILGKDTTWLLNQIKEEILEHRDEFFQGDTFYSEIVDD